VNDLPPAQADRPTPSDGALGERIRDQLDNVVLGQTDVIEQMVVTLLAGGHALIEGPPGTAKTLAIRALALALDVDFKRVQFTPDLMPTDLTGVNVFDERTRDFVFREGPVFTDLLLADEINRAPAKTQAALLEAMQEAQVTTDGVSRPLSDIFTVFASQNPIEYEGTFPLPEAQLDRFLMKIHVGYPSAHAEREILDRYAGGFRADRVRTYPVEQVTDRASLAALRDAVRRTHAEPAILDYVTAIVRATREEPTFVLGASPRASVALYLAAQGRAVLHGRDFVTPDDVKELAAPVLRHRVLLTPDAEVEGRTADERIDAILDLVEAPS
jgi:MoxR-like ATPase